MRLPWSSWPGQCVHVRIHGPLEQALEGIKKKYAEVLPDFLIDYRLVSDMYDSQYQQERKAFSALQATMWIIVLIASIGIFSMAVFMSLHRMKEFGIRKVLGASATQITILHVNHFLKIALMANVIALPVAWWMTNTWLEEFAYHIDLSAIALVVIGITSFLLVIVSAGYSSLRAGRMNPVDVIKKE